MATFFDGKRSFKDVTIGADDGINTTEFLEAAEGVVQLFGEIAPGNAIVHWETGWLLTDLGWVDVLGSTAFSPVKSDMTGNIKVSPALSTHAPLA